MDFELWVRVITSFLWIVLTISLAVGSRKMLKQINAKVASINSMLDEMRAIDRRRNGYFTDKKDTLN